LAITARRSTGTPVTMHLPGPSNSSTQGVIAHAGLELLDAGVARRVVRQMRQHELAARLSVLASFNMLSASSMELARLQIAVRRRAAGAMLLDDSGKGAQGLIGLP
jgi:hypothetical protein